MKKIISAILLVSVFVFHPCMGQKKNAKRTEETNTSVVTESRDFQLSALPDLRKDHNQIMVDILGMPKKQIRTIGILVYDGFFTLDAIGPMSVLSEMIGTEVFFIAKEKGMISNGQVTLQVDSSIAEVSQLDILIVPGGYTETYKAAQDTAITNWIKKIDKQSQITASVCTGAWILGAAGVLKDKKATTHWYYKAQEILEGYGAEFQKKRYVIDGKYWSSAGVTAGMDMCLAMVQDIMGTKYTQGVMLDLEYDPAPPVDAGSPEKADKDVMGMMVAMYDMGIVPLIEQYAKEKKDEKSGAKKQ